MKKKSLILLLVFVLAFCLAACGSGNSEEPAEEPAAEETTEAAETEETADVFAPASKDGIAIDAEAGKVAIYAQVNGTFFDQSTMHGIVFKDGGAGDSAMMAAYVDSQDFYNAMIEAGGEPWNTTDAKLEDGEFTDGQKVSLTLTWDGQTEPVALGDALKTDDGRPDIDIRFSGNQQGNKNAGSGCITCLNSCWAGICTNAAYPYGAIDAGNPHVYLDDSVMPSDGTDVLVTYTIEK